MPFPRKTAFALLVAVAALVMVHLWKTELGLAPAVIAETGRFGERTRKLLVRTPEPGTPIAAPANPAAGTAAPVVRPALAEFLYDDTGALDAFYDRLGALENPGSEDHVAILHYGDSPTTADLITGDVRALLQQRFGDAGHGYLLTAKPWEWYGHRGTDIAAHGWTMNTAVGKGHADIYGLGGASFEGASGASSRFILKDGTQTSMELSFFAQPDGGTIAVSAAGAELATIDTKSDAREPGWRTVPLPAGTKAVDVKVVSGRVELFGETFARSQRGILYDSLGLNGASTTVLSRGFNADVWEAELRHDAPALVVINYGTNESNSAAFVEKQYEKELRSAIARIRTALPNVSILVMSPMDRGERHGIDDIETMATIPEIVHIQKRVAADARCAFFNTYDAMGGDGTMSRWYTGHPRMVAADLIHPTPQGAGIIAQMFVKELLEGYDKYRGAHVPSAQAAAQRAVNGKQAHPE